jgi:hypothetical protein
MQSHSNANQSIKIPTIQKLIQHIPPLSRIFEPILSLPSAQLQNILLLHGKEISADLISERPLNEEP